MPLDDPTDIFLLWSSTPRHDDMWRCPEDPYGSRNPLVQSCILVQNDITLYFATLVRTNSQYWKPILLPDLAGAKRVQTRPSSGVSLSNSTAAFPLSAGQFFPWALSPLSWKIQELQGIERRTSAVGLFDLRYLFSFYLLILSPCILWYKRSKSTKNTWWIWGYTICYKTSLACYHPAYTLTETSPLDIPPFCKSGCSLVIGQMFRTNNNSGFFESLKDFCMSLN